MGKRELLIIVAFVVVGAVAFQFTAPAPTTSSSWNFADLFDSARKEMRGNPGRGSFVHAATLKAPSDLREIRIVSIAGAVQVVGESRDDISYEFTVTSNGPDDAGAVEWAKQTVIEKDDLGEAIILRGRYPEPGSQTATMTMKVPSRLAVRVESGRGVTIANVASVHLEGNREDVSVTNVTGAITGLHQDGDVTITGAQSAKIRLTRAQSVITKVRDGLILDVRDGDAKISECGGAMEVDETRAELTITGHRGTIAVRGSDGRVTIHRPTEDTRVDVRRAEVELLLDRAVAATLLTTDEPLRLLVAGTPGFVLDASTTDAKIQATDLGLTPEVADPNARLTHTFGSGGARVTLRNTRGEIILRKGQ